MIGILGRSSIRKHVLVLANQDATIYHYDVSRTWLRNILGCCSFHCCITRNCNDSPETKKVLFFPHEAER